MKILDTTYRTEFNLWEIERSINELKELDDKLHLYFDEIKQLCVKIDELLEVISGS